MLRFFLPLFLALLSCGFVALPIQEAANSSRTDAKAADGVGGWLDLGGNDLSILPGGQAKYAGQVFVLPPSGDENAKNCLVLGRNGAQTAALKLKQPVGEKGLFLLHAIANGPTAESHTAVGKVVVSYADGTTASFDVCSGMDVSEWTSGRSFKNAVRAWTEYNHNTQVSLFVSQFELDGSKKLAEVRFEANGKCPWMVLAASAAKPAKLVPVCGSVEPTGNWKSPEPPPADLGRFPGVKPKNVILIIGDGMGQGAARLSSYYKHGREDGLYFQQLPISGICSTFSANAPVTDSAASATAFATGTKTSNGVLGLQVDGQHSREKPGMLTSVAARAKKQGLGVAIISSDPIYGATPAAFFAHVTARGNAADICAQAADCGYDILIGSRTTEPWFRPEAQGGKRQDGRDLVAEMGGKGYALVHTAEEMAAAPAGSKILGSIKSFWREASLGEVVKASLDRLAANTMGFFMMAETADTDHACHANNADDAVRAVSHVEFMAQQAVDFARARKDTLVIVTADHDTGHPVVVRGAGVDGRLNIQWTATSHTMFSVPVYAYGPGAELFEGQIDNTDIAKNVARLLQLAE